MTTAFPLAAVAAAALLAPAALAIASPLVSHGSLTLEQATALAYQHHPRLAGFEPQWQVHSALAEQFAQPPATQVELMAEDFLGQQRTRDWDNAQTTISLSRVMWLGQRREARAAVSQAEGSLLRREQDVQRLDVLADLSLSFIEVLSVQHKIALAQTGLGFAKQHAQSTQQRVQAGAERAVFAARARIQVAEAELLLEDLEHSLVTARQALIRHMGEPELKPQQVQGRLAIPAAEPALQAVLDTLESSPQLRALIEKQRVQSAQLRLEQSRARGQIQATLGLRRLEGLNDTAWVAGISHPLFSQARAQPKIKAARAATATTQFQLQDLKQQLRLQLTAHIQELRHARHVAAVLRSSILPELDTAVAQTESAYRRGQAGWQELASLHRDWLSAQLRLVDTQQRYHQHAIDIERLSGHSLQLKESRP
nr:TolC family protein [Oceanococcus sp. HetDA_MAG_MS8]